MDVSNVLFVLHFLVLGFIAGQDAVDEFYSIKGRLTVKRDLVKGHNDWLKNAYIFADGGKYIGIPK